MSKIYEYIVRTTPLVDWDNGLRTGFVGAASEDEAIVKTQSLFSSEPIESLSITESHKYVTYEDYLFTMELLNESYAADAKRTTEFEREREYENVSEDFE
ncbi:MAG: hypothetical protein IPQ08_06095 [Chitinophagaceae bacterium]|nr:hypothetical protein [Chitinophagaceae bacterium]